jgi:hypothetical protein
MLPNAFIGKLERPTGAELSAALGDARTIWDQLLARLAEDLGLATVEWGTPSPKYGWTLRVMAKKRRIVYFGPHQGSFGVAFVLGDRAVEAARHSKLPRKLLQLVEQGDRYPEGTGVRMEIARERDIAAVVKLAAIKLAN